ncbi:MAG: amino acid permease [Candidatus Dadabacteria bacterium]|nr:amino acid permease [Candidatus Dadabacteria bacterium]NIQ16632.1 amino acid permease [Candidatus Dadabacteria bacterium]
MDKKLKRVITLPLITFYGIGSILGAGIYVLISKISGISGMHMPVSFIVAAIVASFSAFSYAEMSSRFPKSAGEAVYVNEAFSIKWISALVGWAIVAVGIVSVATLANGIVGYTQIFINLSDSTIKLLIVSILFLISIWGVGESVIVASVITVVELIGLFLIIFFGFDSLLTIPQRLPELIPPFSISSYTTIIFGAFLSFYAYIGFEDMVNMAEEIRNPERNLPISIILVLIITTILYVLVALVAVLSLPLDQLSSSEAPFVDLIRHNSNFPVSLIGIISLVAVLNGMLIQIIMASRILFGMSKNGMAPKIFSHIYTKTMIPLKSTFFVYIVIIVSALLLPLVSLAKLTSTIILLVFASVNLSLFVVKKRDKNFPEATNNKQTRFPIIIPIIGFFLCLGFLFFQLISLTN